MDRRMSEVEEVMALVAERGLLTLTGADGAMPSDRAAVSAGPAWQARARQTRQRMKRNVRAAGSRLPPPAKDFIRYALRTAKGQPHQAVVAQQSEIERLRARIIDLERRLQLQAALVAELEIELDDVHEDFNALESLTIGSLESGGVFPSGEATARREAAYADFESRFRGGLEEITALLTPYLADVGFLRGGGLPLIDIGPGRGEWLKLLRANDIPAQGIDLNARFVEDARNDGLDVVLGDATVLLERREPESVGAVTAFHVVEHLSPEQVERLLAAAIRALVPGGVLIMETPNPSNVRVGANTFWLDATHRKPVPAELLQFLTEANGFVDPDVRFIHPTPEYETAADDLLPEPLKRQHDDLRWALYGPQDYAIVAVKPASSDHDDGDPAR
jgi:O-antigen chain-terminating methyltransferase